VQTIEGDGTTVNQFAPQTFVGDDQQTSAVDAPRGYPHAIDDG